MTRSLEDRMKGNYEDRQRLKLLRRVPVIVRVDGRAFHRLPLEKPFDTSFANAMIGAAVDVVGETQGCKLAYVQSDEASFLLTDYDSHETEAYFDYDVWKLCSGTAALMSVFFRERIREYGLGLSPARTVFDARAFNVPREEVANYFLWRARDCRRNSVFAYARSLYSARELHGRSGEQQLEMIRQAGRIWHYDVPARMRHGTYVYDGPTDRVFAHHPDSYAAIAAVVEPFVREPAADPAG